MFIRVVTSIPGIDNHDANAVLTLYLIYFIVLSLKIFYAMRKVIADKNDSIL